MDGHDIKMLRHSRRETQKEFAKTLGVNPVTVCHWERGYRSPSPPKMLVLKQLQPTADLVAKAAPEMLAILERFVKHEIRSDFAGGLSYGALLADAKRAIAKAKGAKR